MSSEAQRTLLAHNEEYAHTYTRANLTIPPSKKHAIVTCMDARLDPATAYGISLSEVNIIRNASSSARDALRSLLLSSHLLGTREIMVVKHTRCGLLGATNEMAREVVGKSLGYEGEAVAELEKIDFLPIADLKEAAREDVEFLRENKLILKEVRISGWVRDIDTGRVAKVAE